MHLFRRVDAIEQWITPRRAMAAALVLLGVDLASSVVWLATCHGLMDRLHQPLGGDFIIFYAASRLTLAGHALLAFSAPAMLAAERAAVAGTPVGLLWCYPPPFQLLIEPLALAPFALAYGLWVACGTAAYLTAVRSFCAHRRSWLFALAFPGLFVTVWQGQTTLFVFAVLALGLTQLDRRPWLAGAVLGLTVCKPQFALLLPLLLLGTGRWRSVAAASASILVLALVSAGVFGVAQWRAFLVHLPDVATSLARGELPWFKMPSVFVALSWMGAPERIAMGVHGLAAAVVALATLAVWRRPGAISLKAALAICATLIVTPYSFNYDLVMLAAPIAALVEAGRRRALPTGTKLAILLAVLTPGAFLGFVQATHLQVTPLAILFVFWTIWRVAIDPAPAAARRVVEVPAGVRPLAA